MIDKQTRYHIEIIKYKKNSYVLKLCHVLVFTILFVFLSPLKLLFVITRLYVGVVQLPELVLVHKDPMGYDAYVFIKVKPEFPFRALHFGHINTDLKRHYLFYENLLN